MAKPSEKKPSEHQVRIEIDDTVADGTYANLAFIATNNSEFILDFARFLPGNTRGKVVSRIVFGPIQAKALLMSLTEAVNRYEQKYGTITPEMGNKDIGFNINSENIGSMGTA